jgi:hypothetical protein
MIENTMNKKFKYVFNVYTNTKCERNTILTKINLLYVWFPTRKHRSSMKSSKKTKTLGSGHFGYFPSKMKLRYLMMMVMMMMMMVMIQWMRRTRVILMLLVIMMEMIMNTPIALIPFMTQELPVLLHKAAHPRRLRHHEEAAGGREVHRRDSAHQGRGGDPCSQDRHGFALSRLP